jgi:sulfide:quinone oxidoreductase
MGEALRQSDCGTRKFQVAIVGGGCAGITVAALLRRMDRDLSIAIIEPSERHWYQPGFTFVGSGVFTRAETERKEIDLIPKGVTWIKNAAAEFLPASNALRLDDGSLVAYDFLVACPGLKLDWKKVEGLEETIGRNGVCSNYLPRYAEYTWECVKNFKGGAALFTQPPLPIKCAGAPQKIMYLAADHWRRKGLLPKANIEFCLAGDVLFGVPFFVPALQSFVDRYGAAVKYKHNLKAIDGAAKTAIFAVTAPDGSVTEAAKRFDMIHVTPPQCAPDFVRASPLANAAGWIDVDQATLRHVRYPNIFGLGDATSTPNAKTAAAVRKQAPVVVENLIAAMRGAEASRAYDGYGSCPLTVAYGKIILAEFGYGGKVTPTFPLDPRKPRRLMWHLKTLHLPWLYWTHMFSGGTFDIPHKERRFT